MTREGKSNKERRAKAARRSSRLLAPRPPLLRDFTKESGGQSQSQKQNPLPATDRAAAEGSIADAFFGASPVVASVLGIRPSATPGGQFDSNAPSRRIFQPAIRKLRKEARRRVAFDPFSRLILH